MSAGPGTTAPDVLRRLTQLRRVGYLVLAAMALFFMGSLALAAASLRTSSVLYELETGSSAFVSDRVMDETDTLINVGIVTTVLALVAMAVFLNRATHVSTRLGGSLRYGPRWAFFGLFVPVAAFWVPKRVMQDLWVWSARPDDTGVTRPMRGPRWIGWVWGLFVVTALIDRGLSVATPSNEVTGFAAIMYALCMVIPPAAGLYVMLLVQRLEVRARALGLEGPHPLPRGHRFAVPLAAAAALVALSGSAVAGLRTAAVPDDAFVADPVAELAPPEPPYTLTTGPLSVQLAARPTQEVTRDKLSGGTAVNTTWTVESGVHEQMVATYVLPRGMEFTMDARGMLQASAKGADLTLGPVQTGRVGKHAWAEAEVTAADGTTVSWRVLRIGRIRVDLMAPADELAFMVATLRVS